MALMDSCRVQYGTSWVWRMREIDKTIEEESRKGLHHDSSCERGGRTAKPSSPLLKPRPALLSLSIPLKIRKLFDAPKRERRRRLRLAAMS
nr:unnamed protein product [Digitaria exilis]